MSTMTNLFGISLESQVSTEDNICLPDSGSYDHTVKLWDSRCNSSVLTVDHGSPIECLQLFPTGGLCISAGEYMQPGLHITTEDTYMYNL